MLPRNLRVSQLSNVSVSSLRGTQPRGFGRVSAVSARELRGSVGSLDHEWHGRCRLCRANHRERAAAQLAKRFADLLRGWGVQPPGLQRWGPVGTAGLLQLPLPSIRRAFPPGPRGHPHSHQVRVPATVAAGCGFMVAGKWFNCPSCDPLTLDDQKGDSEPSTINPSTPSSAGHPHRGGGCVGRGCAGRGYTGASRGVAWDRGRGAWPLSHRGLPGKSAPANVFDGLVRDSERVRVSEGCASQGGALLTVRVVSCRTRCTQASRNCISTLMRAPFTECAAEAHDYPRPMHAAAQSLVYQSCVL